MNGDKPRIPPSERLLNIAKILAIIIPLFGVGWLSNTDTARNFVSSESDTKPVVDDETPIQQTQTPEIQLSCPEVQCPVIDYSKIQCSIDGHVEELH